MKRDYDVAFFDVDGTLVDKKTHQISPKTVQVLQELQQAGTKLVVATGRSPDLVPQIPAVNFDLQMCFNGSYVSDGQEVLFEHVLAKSDVEQVIRNADRMGLAACIATLHDVVFNGWEQNLADYLAIVNIEDVPALDFDRYLQEPVFQMMVGVRADQYDQLLQDAPGAAITAWWQRAADVIPAGSSKGEALEAILLLLGADRKRTIAFGDGDNDVSMLQAAGTGVAMGNATDAVKEKADLVCGPIDQDGIWAFFHPESED